LDDLYNYMFPDTPPPPAEVPRPMYKTRPTPPATDPLYIRIWTDYMGRKGTKLAACNALYDTAMYERGQGNDNQAKLLMTVYDTYCYGI
jgi:hypothetical protein